MEALARYQQGTEHAEELTLQPGITQEVDSTLLSTQVQQKGPSPWWVLTALGMGWEIL